MAKNQDTMQIIRETQVNTPASMRTIKPGTTANVPCTEFSPLGTVKSAATRLNQQAGFTEFEVTTPDNGATITITRHNK